MIDRLVPSLLPIYTQAVPWHAHHKPNLRKHSVAGEQTEYVLLLAGVGGALACLWLRDGGEGRGGGGARAAGAGARPGGVPGGAVRRRRRGAVDVGVQLHRLGHQEGPLLPGRQPRVHV